MKKNLDSLVLANYLRQVCSRQEKEYILIIKKIIKQNNLKDFDDVQLMPSSIQLKSLNLVFFNGRIEYQTTSKRHRHHLMSN